MRNAPLVSAGRRELVEMICPTGITEYFFERDWTAQISLNRLAKSVFARTRQGVLLADASQRHPREFQLICPSGIARQTIGFTMSGRVLTSSARITNRISIGGLGCGRQKDFAVLPTPGRRGMIIRAVLQNEAAMRALAAGLLITAVAGSTAAQAAPSALYGKSVIVNWTENRSQRAVGQEPSFHPVSIPFTMTVYISTQGNIFRRLFAVASTGKSSGSKDIAGAGGTRAEGSSSVRFQGNAMITDSATAGGLGHHIQVTFDSGFASCTAQVIAARQTGSKTVMVRSIASGKTIEIESSSVGATSCSVAQGNPFAR